MRAETILVHAEFDPKARLYWCAHGLRVHFLLVFTGVGLFTLPVSMFIGPIIVSTRHNALSAELTERSAHLRTGVLSKVEKTVPPDKIQDLSLRTGPILTNFGLASVQVETPGQAATGADMDLPGLSNAQEFRDAVPARRDHLSGRNIMPTTASAVADTQVVELLKDSATASSASRGVWAAEAPRRRLRGTPTVSACRPAPSPRSQSPALLSRGDERAARDPWGAGLSATVPALREAAHRGAAHRGADAIDGEPREPPRRSHQSSSTVSLTQRTESPASRS